MNFITENWWLILILVVSGFMLAWPIISGQNSGLTPEQATQLINRSNAVFVDVRSEEAYEKEHINNAKNVPLKQLTEKLPKAVKNKSFPIILVCDSGRTAFHGIVPVKQLGYGNVQVLSGGMQAWHSANLPTKLTKKA